MKFWSSFFISLCLAFQAFAGSEPCGYYSREKLLKSADEVLMLLSSLKLSPLEAGTLPADPVFLKVLEHPQLKVLREANYLKGEMIPMGDPQIYPAYNLKTKKVMIPESWYQYKAKQLGDNFPAVLNMTVWHEFGHTVYEAVLDSNPKLKNKFGDPDLMKGHLIVDGIAMRLMNLDPRNFAELVGLASYGGYFTFDLADRQKCLFDLK